MSAERIRELEDEIARFKIMDRLMVPLMDHLNHLSDTGFRLAHEKALKEAEIIRLQGIIDGFTAEAEARVGASVPKAEAVVEAFAAAVRSQMLVVMDNYGPGSRANTLSVYDQAIQTVVKDMKR